MTHRWPQATTMSVGRRSGSFGAGPTSPGSANTKSGWSEIYASTPAESQGFFIWFGLGTASNRWLVDVGIGGAGSEVVLVENIYVQNTSHFILGEIQMYIPLNLPSGTRLAVRCQSQGANEQILMSISTLDVKGNSVGYNNVETIGAVTATSKGTSVDAGPTIHTKGDWFEISDSIAGDYRYVGIAVQMDGDLFISADTWNLVDIGVGAAGSEVVVLPDFALLTDIGFDSNIKGLISLPLSIPKGSRVSMRHQSFSNATDARNIDTVIYGYY